MAKNLLQNSCDLASTAPTGTAVGSSQGFILVQEQTVTSASQNITSINFLNLAQYPYQNYKLLITNASGTGCNLYFSSTNGTNFLLSGYISSNSSIEWGTSSFNNVANSTTSIRLDINTGGTESAAVWNVDVDIFNMNLSPRNVAVVGNGVYFDGSNSWYGFITGVCPTFTANAMQLNVFAPNSVIAGGTFSLYGYNQ